MSLGSPVSQSISLRVHYATNYGETLYVAGPLWGAWKVPQMMTWNTGSWWEFVFNLPIPASGTAILTYKYLVKGPKGETWEGSENRNVEVTRGQETLLVQDKWGNPADTKITRGMTDEEKQRLHARQREEDAKASAAGIKFFNEMLAKTKEESVRKRRELEEAMLREEERRASEMEKSRLKKLKHRHGSVTPSPSTSPLTIHIPPRDIVSGFPSRSGSISPGTPTSPTSSLSPPPPSSSPIAIPASFVSFN